MAVPVSSTDFYGFKFVGDCTEEEYDLLVMLGDYIFLCVSEVPFRRELWYHIEGFIRYDNPVNIFEVARQFDDATITPSSILTNDLVELILESEHFQLSRGFFSPVVDGGRTLFSRRIENPAPVRDEFWSGQPMYVRSFPERVASERRLQEQSLERTGSPVTITELFNDVVGRMNDLTDD